MAALLEFRIPVSGVLIEVGGLGFLVVDLDDLGVWLLLSHSYNYNYVLGEKSSKIGYYFHYLEGIKLNPSYNFLGIWALKIFTFLAQCGQGYVPE